MTKSWRLALFVLGVMLAFLAFGFLESWKEIFALWLNTEAYAHGPLVPLISAWLVWRLWPTLAALVPHSDWRFCIALIACAGVWMLGDLLQVAAMRHFAVVIAVIAAVGAAFGITIARALVFPLGFLLFAVPFGDFLTEPMMNKTADFTVWALQSVGIPVYREARLLQIPSGNWSVVEACSGTRYLIASIMLGALYTYLFYRSAKRRALFMLAAILLPIVGNWVRAFLIVLVGHLTENRLGIGADHIVFGWVFFGALIFALFSVGARWREDKETDVPALPSNTGEQRYGWTLPVVAAIFASILPFAVSNSHSQNSVEPIVTFNASEGWTASAQATWKPEFSGDRARALEGFSLPSGRATTIFRAKYRGQRDSYRMIRWGNVFVDQASDHAAGISTRHVKRKIGSDVLAMIEHEFREGKGVRLIRGAYIVDGESDGSDYISKLRLARKLLMGRGDESEVVAWSIVAEDAARASSQLNQFERDFAPQIVNFVRPKAAR